MKSARGLALLYLVLVSFNTLAQNSYPSYNKWPYHNIGLHRSPDGKQLYIELEVLKSAIVGDIRLDIHDSQETDRVSQQTMLNTCQKKRMTGVVSNANHPNTQLLEYVVPIKKALPKGKATYLVFYGDYFNAQSFFVFDTIRVKQKYYDYRWAVKSGH